MERVSKWVCGNYVVESVAGSLKLSIAASLGLAEYAPPETLKMLFERADAEMYRQKATIRAATSR